MAIFDPSKATSDIDSLIGAVNYNGDKGDSNGVTRKSPIEVVEEVLHLGGVPIPAHTDKDKGLLRLSTENSNISALDPNTLAQLFEFPYILAMEVANAHSTKPAIYHQHKTAWSEVLGSDSHHLIGAEKENYPGSHYTWVKMARPSIDGLRLALLDGGELSIRRSDTADSFEPPTPPNQYIRGLEIENARYMGRNKVAEVRFSPWFNAIVGGRGTGKSTLIHGLRLAARREAEIMNFADTSEPRITFERFVNASSLKRSEGALTPNTSIRLNIMRDSILHRIHWSKEVVEAPVEEKSDNANWVSSDSQIITPDRFPVSIFSQGQIAELSGDNQQALLQIIDSAAGVAGLHANLSEAQNTFFSTRAQIRELEGKLSNRDRLEFALQDTEKKLERFETDGYQATLTNYRTRTNQSSEINRRFEIAEEFARTIEAHTTKTQPSEAIAQIFDSASGEDQAALQILSNIEGALQVTVNDLANSVERLWVRIASIRSELGVSIWKDSHDEASSQYYELVDGLREVGVTNLTDYEQLVNQRQERENDLKALELVKQEKDKLLASSIEQQEKILEARRAISVRREEFLSRTLDQNSFVQIDIRHYGNDVLSIENSFREIIDVRDNRFQDDILNSVDGNNFLGIVSDLLANLPNESVLRRNLFESRLSNLKIRLQTTCIGGNAFGGHFSNYLGRQFELNASFLDRLLTWYPEDGLDVRYSRTGNGKDFQPIAQASAGQRAAAMLAFLLAHGEEPLVLDQPEDDLDNQLIYDLIVRQIRENKFRRQIIVVTHNPNIVVNGDSEMLHVLDFHLGQCVVSQSGSLQENEIRERVCQVMEGGREAFERRYRRLGAEFTQSK